MTCTFISGEYQQIFYRVIEAESQEEAEAKAKEYQESYYDSPGEYRDGNTMFYWHGEIAVTLEGVDPINAEELITKLRV